MKRYKQFTAIIVVVAVLGWCAAAYYSEGVRKENPDHLRAQIPNKLSKSPPHAEKVKQTFAAPEIPDQSSGHEAASEKAQAALLELSGPQLLGRLSGIIANAKNEELMELLIILNGMEGGTYTNMLYQTLGGRDFESSVSLQNSLKAKITQPERLIAFEKGAKLRAQRELAGGIDLWPLWIPLAG